MTNIKVLCFNVYFYILKIDNKYCGLVGRVIKKTIHWQNHKLSLITEIGERSHVKSARDKKF